MTKVELPEVQSLKANGQTENVRPVTRFEYDETGFLLRKIVEVAGGTQVTEFTADPLGRVHSEIDPSAPQYVSPTNQSAQKSPTTVYLYDENGNLKQVTGPNGEVTTYDYDQRNQKIKVTTPGSITAPNAETKLKYDALGNVKEVTDARQATTKFEYDSLGRKTKETDSAPGAGTSGTTAPVFENQYNDDGQLYVSIAPRDGSDRVFTTHTYDASGRLETTKFGTAIGQGVEVVHYTYDENGNVKTSKDAGGNETSFDYDAQDRLEKTTLPATSAGRAYIRNVYNNAGEIVEVHTSYPGGERVVTNHYDADGRKVSVEQPHPTNAGQTITTVYQYDRLGNLRRVTTPGDAHTLATTTEFVYDALNRQTEIHLPDPTSGAATSAPSTKIAYDVSGDQRAVTDALGNTTRYDYDLLHHVTKIIQPPTATQPAAIIEYRYDANGNRDRMISPGVANNGTRITDYTFDELNRNVRIEDAAGMATVITYDPDGKQNDVFVTGGSETKYKYDTFGRVLEQKVLRSGSGTTAWYEREYQWFNPSILSQGNRLSQRDP